MKYIHSHMLKEYRDNNSSNYFHVLGMDMDDVVVDHDHTTGMIRGVIHRQTNSFEGKVFNAWKRYAMNNARVSYVQALRNLADYIETSKSLYLHPVGLNQLSKRFSRLSKESQIFALKNLKGKISEIKSCQNGKDRCKLYRKLIKNL